MFRRNDAGLRLRAPRRHARRADRPLDIYIAAEDSGDASSGDTVLVRARSQDGSRPAAIPKGSIVEVIERQTHQFVGTYFEIDRHRLRADRRHDCSRSPSCVGDPGAKNAQPDDKVVVEMVRFPSPPQKAKG